MDGKAGLRALPAGNVGRGSARLEAALPCSRLRCLVPGSERVPSWSACHAVMLVEGLGLTLHLLSLQPSTLPAP